MLHRIFTLGLLAVAASALHAQTVTLLDESFEGASGGALPTGWVDANQSLGITVTNPATAGINSSATALTFTETTGNPIVNSGAIDLSSYVSAGVVDGYTFTLSFDLYDAANTDNHNL